MFVIREFFLLEATLNISCPEGFDEIKPKAYTNAG